MSQLFVKSSGGGGDGGAVNFITQDGTATEVDGDINIFGNETQGITTEASGSTVTITAYDATTSQKGVSELATDSEAIAGSSTSVVLTPSNLSAKLGDQTSSGIPYGQGTTSALGWTDGMINGELVIGVTAGVPAVGNITSLDGSIAISNGPGTIDIEIAADVAERFDTDSGSAIPAGGILEVFGGVGNSTSAAGDRITIDLDVTVPLSFPTDAGTATSTANAITIAGGTGCATAGAGSTVTINLDETVATSYTTDSGSAVPAAGVLQVLGDGVNVTTSGAADTITITQDVDATLNTIQAEAVDTSVSLFAGLTTGTLSIGGSSQTGTMSIAPSDGDQTITLASGTGAKLITLGSTSGASATTIQAGTGNFVLNGAATTTYTMAAATTSGTISIGGTAQTGTLTLAPSTGNQTIDIATGTGVKGINIATGVGGHTLNIAGGANTAPLNVDISNGASGANSNVKILSGAATAGTQTLQLAIGNGVKNVQMASTGTGAKTVTIGSTGTTSTTTINAGSGNINTVGNLISTSGYMTIAAQPSFGAYANTQSNATGDNTDYSILYANESYDRAGNFASSIFTAPVTGIYTLSGNVQLSGFTPASHTSIVLTMVAGGTTYSLYRIDAIAADFAGITSMNFSLQVALTATNTAIVKIKVAGGTKTISVVGGLAATLFAGTLLC